MVVTNLYPTERKPQWGTFVKEQVDYLKKSFPNDLEIDVYLIDSSKSNLVYLDALLALPRLARKNMYELVHAHYGLSLISLLFVSLPIVVTFHGTDLLFWPVKIISKILSYKASRHIVVSKNLQKELPSGVIIPCGIEVDKFFLPKYKLSNNSEAEIGSQHIVALFPANPSVKVKNYSLFRKVCKRLETRGKIVKEIHLCNIPRDEVPAVYWKSSVMILTSFREGSPTVVKEAIAAKLPFVSVDVGDVKEWVDCVDFGVVVKSRDPDKIADNVIELLGRISSRDKLDNTRSIDKMEITNISRRLKSLYDDVLCEKNL